MPVPNINPTHPISLVFCEGALNDRRQKMQSTPKLDLPFLMPNQAQKHVTLNTSLEVLDILVQLSVISDTQTEQPASPDEGDSYILPNAPQGVDWATRQSGEIVSFRNGAWSAHPPMTGLRAWVSERARLIVFDGTQWMEVVSGGSALGQPVHLGIQTPADDTNRLAVSSPASLFTHAGSDHRLKINKATGTDTAALCFQTDYHGRAELGLTGDDNWHIRTSQDGAVWRDVLIADTATGRLTASTGLTIPGGQRIQSNVTSLGTTDDSSLELEGGGGLGRVALTLKSVVGLTGALFEQRSDHPANIDLIDFGLKTLTHQINLRVEGRTAFTATGAPEFQIRDAGSTSATPQTIFAASSKQAAVRVPFQLQSLTFAELPGASSLAIGAMVFVTDAAGGPTIVFTDGTIWRRVSNNAVVST